MDNRAFELVSLTCEDGLELDALWVTPPNPRAAVVHVHGKGGNFYHNAFLRSMYSNYPNRNVALLGVNTRGNAALVEGKRGNDVIYVGSARERLSECLLDISAAVDFARQRVDRVVLQGHSYGCDKVVYYARANPDMDLVLISPANSITLQERYFSFSRLKQLLTGPVDAQSVDGWNLAPRGYYGVRTSAQEYDIPVETHVLKAMLDGEDLTTFDYAEDPTPISAKALVLIGGTDDLQLGRATDAVQFCSKLIPRGEVVLHARGDHFFCGYEAELSALILDWILGNAAHGQ